MQSNVCKLEKCATVLDEIIILVKLSDDVIVGVKGKSVSIIIQKKIA